MTLDLFSSSLSNTARRSVTGQSINPKCEAVIECFPLHRDVYKITHIYAVGMRFQKPSALSFFLEAVFTLGCSR